MAISQMPAGTKRHGMGDRPFAKYAIVRVLADGKESDLGITTRELEDGKTVGWKATNNDKVTSGVCVTHREAVEFLVDGPKSAASKTPAKKSTAKRAAAKAPAKAEAQDDPKGSGQGAGAAAVEPEGDQPASDLTAALKASVDRAKGKVA
jgi:hypothetical protein